MRNSSSNGSKCKSLAWSLIANNKTMFSNLRTGALSASASTLVRSMGPSAFTTAAALARSSSSSSAATRLSTLSFVHRNTFPGRLSCQTRLRRRHECRSRERTQLVLSAQILGSRRGNRQWSPSNSMGTMRYICAIGSVTRLSTSLAIVKSVTLTA